MSYFIISLSRRTLFLFALALVLHQSSPAQDHPAQTQGNATEAFPSAVPNTNDPKLQGNPSSVSSSSSGNADSTLRLGNGDLLDVGVYNVPELASKARVSSNGDIYLPLIDYIHVSGLSVDEAQGVIEKKLSDGGFVKSPHVTVFVSEYASQGASVLGEVTKPGVYPVLGDQRLLDLVSQAGGLTDKAGHSITITRRGQPDKPITVDFSKKLADSTQSNIDVSPGDTIIVHKADVVYVVGDVAKPSGLLIDRENLTVLQAIALAGGTTRTSKLNGSKIIHRSSEGTMTETPVQLKKILQAKLPDIPMKADDILFVPSSAFKSAVRDNAGIALQAASLALVAVR